MNDHLNDEAVARIADGEDVDNAHLRECARCANALVETLRMKRAVRAAVPRAAVPETLRRRIGRQPSPSRSGWWLAAAAVAALAVFAAALHVVDGRRATRELIDLHTTIVAGTTPIDVVSTDRHTVKPWFEGKVPFAVDIPELGATPFRLVGGRLVFWRGEPGAYLLVSKGAHRLSLFVFRSDAVPRLSASGQMRVSSWQSNGLTWIAVSDLSSDDLTALKTAWNGSRGGRGK